MNGGLPPFGCEWVTLMRGRAVRGTEFLRCEAGPTATEYGVIVAMVIIVALSAIASLSRAVVPG